MPNSTDLYSTAAHRPSVSKVMVTPDMAARWLERNTSNRSVSMVTVRRYARDMDAGHWMLTGEGIKFASDGTLLDGQHRLMAIIIHGKPVMMDVHRGIPKEAQRVMDTGRARSAADSLHLTGEKHSTIIAAAARLAITAEAGVKHSRNRAVSNSEIAEFLDANPDLREAASAASAFARKCDLEPSILAYCFLHMARVSSPEAARAFWDSAANKVHLYQGGGDPVVAMTDLFAEYRRRRQSLAIEAKVSLIYRTWNARRQGREVKRAKVHLHGKVIATPELI